MKRALLTGASGFIGRNCIGPLIERGFEVHAVAHTRAVLPDGSTAVTWHRADLLDDREVARLISTVHPTHLVHLAWYVNPADYRTSAENLRWCRASFDLLSRFAEAGGQRAAFAGTCFEYDTRFGFCSEGLTPCTPSTLYGTCKNSMRQIVEAYSAQTGLSTAWCRIFYLYGPHEPSQRLVPSVILALLRGERARCSDGRQIRDFLFVEDVASAFVSILCSSTQGPINIGSGSPISVRSLVCSIATQMDALTRVDFGGSGAPPAGSPLLLPDVRRLRREIGWSARWSLNEGLRSTIQWWHHHLRTENRG